MGKSLYNKKDLLKDFKKGNYTYITYDETFLQVGDKEIFFLEKKYDSCFWTYAVSMNRLKEADVDKNGNVELDIFKLVWGVKCGFLDYYGNFLGDLDNIEEAIDWSMPTVIWEGDPFPTCGDSVAFLDS